jgi:hypothetical protein
MSFGVASRTLTAERFAAIFFVFAVTLTKRSAIPSFRNKTTGAAAQRLATVQFIAPPIFDALSKLFCRHPGVEAVNLAP